MTQEATLPTHSEECASARVAALDNRESVVCEMNCNAIQR